MTGSTKLLTSGGGGVILQTESPVATDVTVKIPSSNSVLANQTYVNTAVSNNIGFRNRIINGDMRIDQRNAGASVTPSSGQFLVDRFKVFLSQASKFTAQQNAGSVTPPSGFVNYLGITSSSAYSSVSTDYFLLSHQVEGHNVSDLGWGTASAASVTLSFWVRSSLTGTFGGAIGNSASNRNYPFSFTISSANTWEQKTVTIAGDTSGTWLTTNGVGLSLKFNLGSGSNFLTTAGAWAAGDYVGPTGATSVVGTSGATFYITGVQLEKGSTATSFDYRPSGTELALCQRYYEKSFPYSVVPANGSSTTTVSGNGDGATCGVATNVLGVGPTTFFKVTKRTQPTMTKWGNSSGDWLYAALTSTSWSGGSNGGFTFISENSFQVSQQVVSGTPLFVFGHWTASAEL